MAPIRSSLSPPRRLLLSAVADRLRDGSVQPSELGQKVDLGGLNFHFQPAASGILPIEAVNPGKGRGLVECFWMPHYY